MASDSGQPRHGADAGHDGMPTTDTTWPASGDWTAWAARWDARMQAFFPHRPAGNAAIMDVLAALLPAGPWRILDVGAGTGSLSRAVLDRFAEATVVAIDLDPVLLSIGRGVLGDADGRLTWRQVNLREEQWPAQVPTPEGGFDAVVSLATLHHFSRTETAGIYRQLAGLIKPGGLLLNAEALAASPTTTRLAQAFNAARRATVPPADGFWEAIGTDPTLAEAVAERETLRGEMRGAGQPLTAEAHCRALRRAGFAEAALGWRHLDEALVVGLR